MLRPFPIVLVVVIFKVAKDLLIFENVRLKAKGLVDRVRQRCHSYRIQGSPNFILARKFKALKVDLTI